MDRQSMATQTLTRIAIQTGDTVKIVADAPSLTERAAAYFRDAIKDNPVVERVETVKRPGWDEIFLYVTTTEAYGDEVDKLYEAWVETRRNHPGSRLDVSIDDHSD